MRTSRQSAFGATAIAATCFARSKEDGSTDRKPPGGDPGAGDWTSTTVRLTVELPSLVDGGDATDYREVVLSDPFPPDNFRVEFTSWTAAVSDEVEFAMLHPSMGRARTLQARFPLLQPIVSASQRCSRFLSCEGIASVRNRAR